MPPGVGGPMDPRFDTSKDPRFRRIPGHVRRVEVDKRFAHMFHDKRFVETPTVDAQGRRLRRDAGRQKLREFYALAADQSEGGKNSRSSETPPAVCAKEKTSKAKAKAKASAGSDAAERVELPKRRKARRGKADAEDEDDGADQGDVVDEAAGPAEEEEEADEDGAVDAEDEDADGEAEEEESEEDDDGEDDAIEPDPTIWEGQDADAEHGDATKRLAVMGCDWEHVSADDLMVMFRTYLTSKEAVKGSVLAKTGTVERIAVYPSDYGLAQLAKEAVEGPQLGPVETGAHPAHGFGGEDDEEARHAEVIRRYQLKRTRFYYAVVECDSVATASWLYDQMDGIEADGVCPGTLDLRFMPDGVAPPHKPTSEASEMPKKYKAPAPLRSAVGHTRVKCTWDEAPAQRKRDLMRKKYSEEDAKDNDLKAYLASSSSEGEGDAEALKALVGRDGSDDDFFNHDDGSSDEDAKGKEVMGNMEATFSLKGEELEEKLTERIKEQSAAKKKGIKTLDAEKPKSVWESYLERKKTKRADRRKEAKDQNDARKAARGDPDAEDGGRGDLELIAQEEEDARGFNMRGKKRLARNRAEAASAQEAGEGEFQVNVDDPRIAQVFQSPDFAIDPTNPEFRRTQGMSAVLKRKRQAKQAALPPEEAAAASSGPGARGGGKKGRRSQ